MSNTPQILNRFIVLEGLDGAGTTTQMTLLAKTLTDLNFNIHSTFEPTDAPIGKLIRQVLAGDIETTPEALARLFTADRHEHLFKDKTGIIPRLNNSEIVICDRYLFSSLAYQSLGSPYETIQDLNKTFPLPEYVFFLHVPEEICQSRMDGRDSREIFETLELQKQIAGYYDRMWKQYAETGMKIIILDGTLPPETVLENICSKLDFMPKNIV